MIITADLANAVSKVNPIFLEGTLKIASAEAKAVGLRDGQIIQAVIENRGDHTKLLIGNKEFEIPKNLHTGDGSKFQAKVSLLANGTAVLTPAGVSVGSGTIPNAFVPLSPHFMNLLLHSSGFGNLSSLYGSGILPSLAAKAGLGDLISRILGLRLSINNLTSSEIKNFIMNFGLFNEALLSKKQKLNPNNQKVLIAQLVRLLNERGIESQPLSKALLDIEASQMETNQGLHNREIFFSLIFPFKEFGDWNFSFSKTQNPENESSSFYTFNLHSKNEMIGEVWLRVVVKDRNNLSMQMWATDKTTYAKAISTSDKLNALLNDAGLKVSSFEVFNEERPGNRMEEASKPILGEKNFSGISVDVEA